MGKARKMGWIWTKNIYCSSTISVIKVVMELFQFCIPLTDINRLHFTTNIWHYSSASDGMLSHRFWPNDDGCFTTDQTFTKQHFPQCHSFLAQYLLPFQLTVTIFPFHLFCSTFSSSPWMGRWAQRKPSTYTGNNTW